MKPGWFWLGISVAALVSTSALAEKPETEMRGEAKSAKVFVMPGENASYLGIDSQDVTAARITALKLKEERGAEVIMVDQDAPAGKAGLKEHDVILEFNGTRVEGVEHLRRLIHEIPPGRTVTLGISRDGQPMTLKAQLADRAKAVAMARPAMRERIVVPPIEMPDMPDLSVIAGPTVLGYSRAGLVVENLTSQLGDFFGVKNGQGVLVRSVERGTPAEASGLKAGDVIVRVEKDRIDDRGDWKLALRNYAGSKVTLGVVRDKREQSLSITLPGRKSSDASWDFDFPNVEDMEYAPFDGSIMKLRKIHTQTITELRAAMHAHEGELRRAVDSAREQVRRQQQQLRREMQRLQRQLERSWSMD
jgi:serine protease Do